MRSILAPYSSAAAFFLRFGGTQLLRVCGVADRLGMTGTPHFGFPVGNSGPRPLASLSIGWVRCWPDEPLFGAESKILDKMSILTPCHFLQPTNTSGMEPLTPKQLEIRQRESQILATASPLIREGGLSAISMDAIAKRMSYTRGTIYNHFPNKEDIVLSLASRAVQRRIDLFELAASLGKKTREKIAAIGIACEVYADLLPNDFAVEQMIRHDSVWAKTSEKRRDVLTVCEGECMGVVGNIVQQAVDAEDFKLPRGRSVSDVCFGLWSLVYGGLVLEQTSPSLANMGIQDSRQAIRRNCNGLLDGLGWKELYDSGRYNRFVKKVKPILDERCEQLAAEDIEVLAS